MRNSLRLGVYLAVAAALLGTPDVGTGQTAELPPYTAPRTPDGHPDLQGVWANNSATPLERPEVLAGKASLSDDELAALRETAGRLFGDGGDAAFGDGVYEAALESVDNYVSSDGGSGNYSTVWMVDRQFENRTSLITDPPDGRLPPLTPAAQAWADARERRRDEPMRDGPEDLSLQVRCITYSVPRVGGLGAGYNSYYQIFQAADHVVLQSEMIHDARVIPLDGGPHVNDRIRLWHGDSRGRWEGETLVVETTNFSPKSLYRGSSENLHLIERFTRVGPDALQYEITLTDPTTWTRPWTAMAPLQKSEDALYEYACHEGNIGMAGILSGTRAEERADATR